MTHLYRLILKSLRSYHTSISKDAELKDLLRNVEILYYKELYNQCHYGLKKAENLALGIHGMYAKVYEGTNFNVTKIIGIGFLLFDH